MREILFKAKRKDNGEWVYGDVAHIGSDMCIYDYSGILLKGFVVDPKTISQYTGLKDKNGKLIFEGYILNYCEDNTEHKNEVVEFFRGCFSTQCLDLNCVDTSSSCEVIGNKFDNPELLTKE